MTHSMRLSLMKGAHADLSSTAWQEIGVKPYFGLSGLGCFPNPNSLYVTITVLNELLANTEGGEDQVQDIVAGGLASERVQMTEPVV